jgi:hypothetical protein
MQTHPQLHDVVTQVHYLIVRNCENLKHRGPVYRVLEEGSLSQRKDESTGISSDRRRAQVHEKNGQSISETNYTYFVIKTLKMNLNALKNEIT